METRTLGRELPVSALGMRKLHRLEENLGAAAFDLTAEDLHAIEAATSELAIHGPRGTGREHYA